ncbi:MAG: 50S ribosomal protein L29 [Bacteroidota bacterium]
MASAKFIELQNFSDEDLRTELQETKQQYQKMKMDHSIRGIENPLDLREVRRDIARLKTEVRRREITAMSAEELANRSKKRARRRR